LVPIEISTLEISNKYQSIEILILINIFGDNYYRKPERDVQDLINFIN